MASTDGPSSRKQLPSAPGDAGRPRVARVPPGFTLVELLVVIAVISLLAAVLFPVLARVREKALQSACLSNLKQIGYAFQMYLGDWDDAYPLINLVSQSGRWPWQLGLRPYVRSTDVYACPTNPYRWWYLEGRGAYLPVHIPISYGMNEYAFPDDARGFRTEQDMYIYGGLKGPYLALHSSDVGKPASLIVVGETRRMGTVGVSPYDAYAVEERSAGRWDPPLAPWQGLLHSHLGRVNFLFADWHAKPMRVIDTFEPENMWVIPAGPGTPRVPNFLQTDRIAPEYR